MALTFNDLPLPVRERFIQLTNAKPLDRRILAHGRAVGLRWLNYVGGIGAVVAIVLILNYTITRGQVVDPIRDKESYLGLAAAVTVLLSSLVGIVFGVIWKKPPFPEGLYAFPSYLVRVRGNDLDVKPIVDIGTPTVVTVRRNGAYVHTRLELGGPFTFYYASDAAAQAAWTSIAQARATFRAMLAARDTAAIASVDPFVECTISGQWTAPGQPFMPPQVSSVPMGLVVARWVGALLIGAVTAGVYYAAIDALFDDDRAEYQKAQQQRFKRR